MLVHQLLLSGALAALAGAGARGASRLSTGPLERIVAAAVLAAAAAAIEVLALGLVKLGASPVALSASAAVTWLAARRLVPPPDVSLWQQLLTAWDSLSPARRFGAGAVVGAGIAWTVWLLRYPGYGWDGLTYHIPEIVAWLHSGAPGSIEQVLPGAPVGNYPLTNEVLLTWGTGISRSLVWITVWPSLMLALLAASSWLGLRALHVPRLATAFAAGSVCAAPLLTSAQMNGPNTDLPALSWLAAAAGLCAAATRQDRAELLAPALLAAAFAVGTKTTAAPLAVIVVGIAAYRLRSRLRPLATPLALAVCGAVVVGGVWYLRNLVEHGSPTWPFFTTPWGDPPPHALEIGNTTFLQRPLETLRRFGDPGYVTDNFLAGLVVLAGALVAPFLTRRRGVATAGAATALSLVLWANAPVTGSPTFSGAEAAFLVSPRYLMPGVGAATVTLALAARDGGRRTAPLWTALLAGALCLNVWQLFALGYPSTPSPVTPLAGALLGGAAALAAQRLPWGAFSRPAGALAAIVALGAVLAVAAPGLVDRHARMDLGDAGVVRWFTGPASDGRPIHMAPVMWGVLASADLGRQIEPIPRHEPCRQIAANARKGWVIVFKFSIDALLGPSTARGCIRGWHPRYEDASSWVFGPGSPVERF